MHDLPLIQYGLGRALRDAGMAQVASRHGPWLEEARKVAIKHARVFGAVSANNIRHYVDHGFLEEPSHPNVYGSIFKSKEFVFTGRYVQSEHASRHAGMVRSWRLK